MTTEPIKALIQKWRDAAHRIQHASDAQTEDMVCGDTLYSCAAELERLIDGEKTDTP
jgi:hypothetical protein